MIFLLVLIGMLVCYPAYFYMLHEFKVRLLQDHPDVWRNRAQGEFSTSLQFVYRALSAVRDGRLDGVTLSERVVASHRVANGLLYAGMVFFLMLLFLGLYDSVWGGGAAVS